MPFEGNVPGSGGEVVVVMAAAVDLALLTTLVPGHLGLFLRLGFQQLVESFLYATSNHSLRCPLITSSFNCTSFSDVISCLLPEWCVATSFYQGFSNYVILFLRNLLYFIRQFSAHSENCRIFIVLLRGSFSSRNYSMFPRLFHIR